MVLRQVLLSAARSGRLKKAVSTMPVSSSVVTRFIAGQSADEAVEAARKLREDGLEVTIDHLGEDTREHRQAEKAAHAYHVLLDRLSRLDLARGADLSVKLSAMGLRLGADGEKIALDHVREIAEAARNVGATVTLDMEDYSSVESTLSVLRELRRDFPDAGVALQAYLRRTEDDCRELAYEGSRVRLCKGAYEQPDSVAYTRASDIDRCFVRCLKILMASKAYPMVATHDPRLIEIAGALAMRHHRARGSYEYQMLYGVRPKEQRRLAKLGETVRVYVPYGLEWYGYMMRRLAERPANLAFFTRSLITRN